MKHFRMCRLSCVLGAVLIALLITAEVVDAASLNSRLWKVIPSPNVAGSSQNILVEVAAVSASNVWAVGAASLKSNTHRFQTLIEHWNGKTWKIVHSPNVSGSDSNVLQGVAAVSASNVWAVGYYTNSSGIDQTLIERWNGRVWNIVPSGPSGILRSVTAVSASNVWAVGYYTNSSGIDQTLIERWNGKVWNIIPSLNVTGSSADLLLGVTASSARNIWAVGIYYTSTTNLTLIEHWNGSVWSIVPSPNVGGLFNTLSGVARVPDSNQVWAVGDASPHSFTYGQSLIEHWNGSVWSIVPSPLVVGASETPLLGVAAISANNAWAVGASCSIVCNMSGITQTLIEHWNGSIWSVVPSPNVGSNVNFLYSVASVPHTRNIWTVGEYSPDNITLRTLTEVYS